MMISMVRRSAVAWGFAAAAVACTARPADESAESSTTIVTTDSGSGECDGVLSHSHTTSGGSCVCDAGYEWENPEDPDDFDCVPGDGSGACMEEHNVIVDGECRCEENYDWCEPNDPNDYTCCGSSDPNPSSSNPSTDTEASTTDVDPTDADTTAGDTDGPTPPDPADCTVDTPDAIFCTNTEAMGPEDSAYFVCTDGEWVDMTASADEQCQFDNYDFAYGCIDDGQAVAFICGNGSGAPCENADDAMCIDAVEIDTCIFGRATQDSCATICSTIGDQDGVTYDGGFCDTEAKQAECICCDEGDPGCP